MQRLLFITITGVLTVLLFNACEKEDFTHSPNAKLSFSVDTLTFDTVFTTVGSTTKRFTVRNPNSSGIEIDLIQLANNDSPFRLNINGVGSDTQNVKIKEGDSLFVFVEATIDPTGQDNPMVIQDSIVFTLNRNTYSVDLLAFGQDVHLINGESIESQQWTNDKPYLIYNSVLVEENHTLIIEQGCRIHFHKNSSMFVEGTLRVNGTYEEPVFFQGDRLEEEYSDLPDQWGAYYENEDEGYIVYYGGIHLLKGSSNNTIDYAVIRNAIKGIQVDSINNTSEPVLQLTNSVIENMTLNCLDARTTMIEASNCIFTNSGYATVRLILGGDYKFTHCTMANYYGAETRSEPTLYLNNFYKYENTIYAFDFNAQFNNCIVHGDLNSEIVSGYVSAAEFVSSFNSCLLQVNQEQSSLPDDSFESCVFNADPLFVNKSENNLAIDSLSPARNMADISISTIFPLDLYANSRLNDDQPDAGAIEWQSQ